MLSELDQFQLTAILQIEARESSPSPPSLHLIHSAPAEQNPHLKKKAPPAFPFQVSKTSPRPETPALNQGKVQLSRLPLASVLHSLPNTLHPIFDAISHIRDTPPNRVQAGRTFDRLADTTCRGTNDTSDRVYEATDRVANG
jgi:hypothetical protein